MTISMKELNRIGEIFWKSENKKFERRMADPTLRRAALAAMNAELYRVPTYHQRSLYEILQELEHNRNSFRKQQAQLAGKADKSDALQLLIFELVERNPQLNENDLLSELRMREKLGVIEEIEDGEIAFRNHNGRSLSAPLSGLKHRLSRAKKKIKSR